MLLLAAAAGADTIRLRNGYSLEGVVSQETDTQVVLDIGTGSTTLSRGTIAAVVHASDEDNQRLQSEWKQKYFLHRDYVPPDLTDLAADFSKLVSRHAQALSAHQALEGLAARELRLKAEQEQLRPQILQTARQLQQTQPNRSNAEAYNALVSENNVQQARWTAIRNELDAAQKEHDSATAQISAYQDAALAFHLRLQEERTKAARDTPGPEHKQFFDRLTSTLNEYLHEFAAAEIPVTPSHAGTVVTATINNQAQGHFILDTGATRVTLTEAFARKLGLTPEALPESEFSMADGHKTKGRIVVLQVVVVGDARAENVEAAILPGNPGEKMDGLLGMSFLRNFYVTLDGGSGKLILRRFAPNRE